ncbi:hypothetical protein ABK735_16150 [Enterobacter kobei]|nr:MULTISPECIES: hypothetical protein [Enterobacterales]MDX7542607.1 hypothetical protein [Serratia marcescens]
MLISPAVLLTLQDLIVLRIDQGNVIAGCLLALIRHASGGQDEQR